MVLVVVPLCSTLCGLFPLMVVLREMVAQEVPLVAVLEVVVEMLLLLAVMALIGLLMVIMLMVGSTLTVVVDVFMAVAVAVDLAAVLAVVGILPPPGVAAVRRIITPICLVPTQMDIAQ